jgi:phenylacetate-CoA ligase
VRADASRRIRPRLVVTGGEEMPAEMRRTIADGFRAPVYDTYGAHEFKLLASECPRTGLYHVCDDALVLEILCDGRPAKEGEEGDVVGTALHSFAMPFVRYQLGDRAVRGPAPCPCGQPFSTLRQIRGRSIDYYRLPGGRLLHHYQLFAETASRAGVRDLVARYQVIQEREDLIVMRLAPISPEHRPAFVRLHEEATRILGPGVEFRIEFVDEFDFEPSGKFRLAISKVKPEP